MHYASSIPLRPVSAFVKFIRPDALADDEKDSFLRYFLDFTGLGTRNSVADAYWETLSGLVDPSRLQEDQEARSRRFSGGERLPRGSYYVLCHDDRGQSHQTLALELLNYASVRKPCIVHVCDLLDPECAEQREAMNQAEGTRAQHLGWRVLYVRARALGASPAVLDTFVLPYEVASMSRQRVFDLRSIEAMQWLFDALNRSFPNAIFLTARSRAGFDAAAVDKATSGLGPPPLGFEAPDGWTRDKLKYMRIMRRGNAKRITAGLRNTFQAGLSDLRDLLAYLLTPESGGTPMTAVIGECIQALGADAMVFPSARENCFAGERAGEPLWGGFNLVDFAGHAPRPPMLWLMEEPQFFARRWTGRVSTNLDLQARCGVGASAGGTERNWEWSVDGNRRVTLGRHRWWVLKEYLAGKRPDAIPRLLVAPHDDSSNLERQREYYSISNVLADLYDGKISVGHRAWGFEWLRVFGKLTSLGEWLAAFSSSFGLFGAAPRPTRYSGGRLVIEEPESGGGPLTVCICCGTERVDSPGAETEQCSSCGFAVDEAEFGAEHLTPGASQPGSTGS